MGEAHSASVAPSSPEGKRTSLLPLHHKHLGNNTAALPVRRLELLGTDHLIAEMRHDGRRDRTGDGGPACS